MQYWWYWLISCWQIDAMMDLRSNVNEQKNERGESSLINMSKVGIMMGCQALMKMEVCFFYHCRCSRGFIKRNEKEVLVILVITSLWTDKMLWYQQVHGKYKNVAEKMYAAVLRDEKLVMLDLSSKSVLYYLAPLWKRQDFPMDSRPPGRG